MKKLKTNNKGITLIALVVTIVVLLILAAVSISMLTGENGIITQAQNSKEQNEIGKEKEYINLAFSAVKAGKISIGDVSDVTSTELQQEINKYTNGATVTGTGILKITYASGREYEIDGSGKILNNSSYDGMYSVGELEGKIAPQDLFEYEIIDEQAKTARILRIKAEYCNIDGFNFRTGTYDVTDTNCDIIYNGEKISDMLVIPYEVTINGGKYTITEANLGVTEDWGTTTNIACFPIHWPNISKVVYPNTIESIEIYESIDFYDYDIYGNLDSIHYWREYDEYLLEEIIFSNKLKNIGESAFEGTKWLENKPDGDVYVGDIYVYYKGDMGDETSLEIKEGTTTIAGGAFARKNGLTNVTIPNSVTNIGEWAFWGCSNLTSITMSENVSKIGKDAFYGTAWIDAQPEGDIYIGKTYIGYKGEITDGTSIVIKDGTTAIGDEAFAKQCGITNITISESVTSIGEHAFYQCEGLTNITIPSSVKTLGLGAFAGCYGLKDVTIQDGLTKIGGFAFYKCNMLENITIPESVISIGEYALYECYNLSDITIPSNITRINNNTFTYCESLQSITLPINLKSIGEGAFFGCLNLLTINGLENLTNLEGLEFDSTAWYESLSDGDIYIGKTYYGYKGEIPENTNITIKDGTTAIGGYAFEGQVGLTNITIPNSVVTIGSGAFYNCTGLTNITIPNSVTSIGQKAFAYCENLTSITIPNSVVTIESRAFYNCKGLINVIITKGLIYIGSEAFYRCTNLSTLQMSNTVTIIDSDVFEDCTKLATVNYAGTEEEWDNLYIYYGNDNLKKATINYNYTSK